jgi:hypothetical protein
MTLALSAFIGMTLAALFTVLRTSSKKQHPNGNKKPWNGGWLDQVLSKTETRLQRVERLHTTTPNTSSKQAPN